MPIDQKIRIISGDPTEVEWTVNSLLDNYAPIMWNIQAGQEGPLVTCILILQSEIRKAQLMAAAMPPGRPI
jgi:hypothetical protein